MILLDIALILQIIFFFFKYNDSSLNKIYEIWVGVILPALILIERFIQNIQRRRNTAANGEESSSNRIVDERSNLRNNPPNLHDQN